MVRFDNPARQIVLQGYIDAITDAERRVDRDAADHRASPRLVDGPCRDCDPGDARRCFKHVWRAEIALLSADGVGTNEIMRRTGKSKTCVWCWQERFM
jgi:hypothetical protein